MGCECRVELNVKHVAGVNAVELGDVGPGGGAERGGIAAEHDFARDLQGREGIAGVLQRAHVSAGGRQVQVREQA